MNYVEVEFFLNPLLPAREVLVYELSEIEFDSFVNTSVGVKAYIQKVKFDEDLFDNLHALKIGALEFSYRVREIESTNWNKKWEDEFDPIWVDRKCLIRAPFHSPSDGDALEIVIAPNMSFGTGHHPTTYLMVQELLEVPLIGKNLLDMGCGTGILAILAKKRGADRVVGIDIEDYAYHNSIENFKLNKLEDICIYKGGAEQIDNQKFDVILANINRNILLKDMEIYVNALNHGGRLLLSGFYTTDNELLESKAENLGLVFDKKMEKDGWSLLSYQV